MIGIQKLEYLTLMSSNQKFTKAQIVNIYENTTWKELAPDEKRGFGLAFMNKALTDSEVSDQLDILRSSQNLDSMYFQERMEELR